MCNIIFTVLCSMTTVGLFNNAPIVWRIILIIFSVALQIILILKEQQQEELQHRVKTLENKVKELEYK